MMKTTSRDAILTPDEAAPILRRRPSTVKARLRQGVIRGFKEGNRWFLFESALQEYLGRLRNRHGKPQQAEDGGHGVPPHQHGVPPHQQDGGRGRPLHEDGIPTSQDEGAALEPAAPAAPTPVEVGR